MQSEVIEDLISLCHISTGAQLVQVLLHVASKRRRKRKKKKERKRKRKKKKEEKKEKVSSSSSCQKGPVKNPYSAWLPPCSEACVVATSAESSKPAIATTTKDLFKPNMLSKKSKPTTVKIK